MVEKYEHFFCRDIQIHRTLFDSEASIKGTVGGLVFLNGQQKSRLEDSTGAW